MLYDIYKDGRQVDVTELSDEQANDDQFLLGAMQSLGHISYNQTLDDLEVEQDRYSIYLLQYELRRRLD